MRNFFFLTSTGFDFHLKGLSKENCGEEDNVLKAMAVVDFFIRMMMNEVKMDADDFNIVEYTTEERKMSTRHCRNYLRKLKIMGEDFICKPEYLRGSG